MVGAAVVLAINFFFGAPYLILIKKIIAWQICRSAKHCAPTLVIVAFFVQTELILWGGQYNLSRTDETPIPQAINQESRKVGVLRREKILKLQLLFCCSSRDQLSSIQLKPTSPITTIYSSSSSKSSSSTSSSSKSGWVNFLSLSPS